MGKGVYTSEISSQANRRPFPSGVWIMPISPIKLVLPRTRWLRHDPRACSPARIRKIGAHRGLMARLLKECRFTPVARRDVLVIQAKTLELAIHVGEPVGVGATHSEDARA